MLKNSSTAIWDCIYFLGILPRTSWDPTSALTPGTPSTVVRDGFAVDYHALTSLQVGGSEFSTFLSDVKLISSPIW